MRRYRPHPFDFAILALILILVWRHWPQSPEQAAWREANLHFARAEWEQAVERFDRVIEARPDIPRVYFYRGISLFYTGRFHEAARDFATGLDRGGDPYMLFWRYLARARGEGGEAGKADLASGMRARSLGAGSWPGVLGAALLGEADEDTVLRLAAGGPPGVQAGQQAEGFFYLGQRRLLDGDTAEAMALFARAVNTGARNYLEYMAAAEELRRRGAPPARPG